MVRRALPLISAAVVLAFAIGALVGGIPIGVSAAAGALVVVANFAVNGYSLAWAAGVSPTFLAGVAAFGFVIRMAVIVAIMFLLNQLSWFSPVAFLAGVVPTMIVLLGFEAKLVMGPMGRAITIPEEQG